MTFFEVWGILWAFSLPFVPYVRRAMRRRRYQRCLARIERLEVELGYRKGPTTYSDVFMGLRPGAAWPTYINAGQMAAQQQQTYANTTLAKLLYEMRGAGRSEDSL